MSGSQRQPRIVVLGSINMDLVARCVSLPRPGETLMAEGFQEIPGGKGANQAIAASRMGGDVAMIGRVGDDVFAGLLIDNLKADGIDCSMVTATAETSSGLAMIAVSDVGENQIIVVSGANDCLTCHDIDRFAGAIREADCLLVQLEIPIETAVHAITLAREAGVRVILDPAPAPASPVPGELFLVDVICPNETEAATLTGHTLSTDEDIHAATHDLLSRGAKAVALTLGDRGTLLQDGDAVQLIPSMPVKAVDTTAAGDAFAGALAVRWAETDSLADAVRWGNVAGALSASRLGAQPSMATRQEIESRLAVRSSESETTSKDDR